MSREKGAPDGALDAQIDAALGSILAQGWDDEVGQAAAAVAPASTPPQSNENWEVHVGPEAVKQAIEAKYPPVPTRDEPPAPRRSKRTTKAVKPDGTTVYDMPLPGQTDPTEPGMIVAAPPPVDDPEAGSGGLFDIGMLADLAAGRKGAAEAAEAAGVTTSEIQSALATALHEVDPKEIAKALGIQAAEQQLKSGALYGAVLYDLVLDMQSGRMKAETKIELAKLLAKVGKLEPKEDKGAGAGGGFVLNISMGTPQPITINAD